MTIGLKFTAVGSPDAPIVLNKPYTLEKADYLIATLADGLKGRQGVRVDFNVLDGREGLFADEINVTADYDGLYAHFIRRTGEPNVRNDAAAIRTLNRVLDALETEDLDDLGDTDAETAPGKKEKGLADLIPHFSLPKFHLPHRTKEPKAASKPKKQKPKRRKKKEAPATCKRRNNTENKEPAAHPKPKKKVAALIHRPPKKRVQTPKPVQRAEAPKKRLSTTGRPKPAPLTKTVTRPTAKPKKIITTPSPGRPEKRPAPKVKPIPDLRQKSVTATEPKPETHTNSQTIDQPTPETPHLNPLESPEYKRMIREIKAEQKRREAAWRSHMDEEKEAYFQKVREEALAEIRQTSRSYAKSERAMQRDDKRQQKYLKRLERRAPKSIYAPSPLKGTIKMLLTAAVYVGAFFAIYWIIGRFYKLPDMNAILKILGNAWKSVN